MPRVPRRCTPRRRRGRAKATPPPGAVERGGSEGVNAGGAVLLPVLCIILVALVGTILLGID